jgi:chemotaxis protein MotB
MKLKELLKKHGQFQEELPVSKTIESSPYEIGHDAHDESNWLVSYADMMTLLCGFFVLLFSLSKVDAEKYERVRESVSKSFGIQYHNYPLELSTELNTLLQERGILGDASLRSDARGVSIIFQSTVFFDSASADLKERGAALIKEIGRSILEKERKDQRLFRITVEGHTDPRPIVSERFPSNWELSAYRASAVVRLLIAQGFNPKLLTAIGYADTRPEISHGLDGRSPARNRITSEESWNQDRRVVLRVETSAD